MSGESQQLGLELRFVPHPEEYVSLNHGDVLLFADSYATVQGWQSGRSRVPDHECMFLPREVIHELANFIFIRGTYEQECAVV